MRCSKCGREIAKEEEYCPYCGTKMEENQTPVESVNAIQNTTIQNEPVQTEAMQNETVSNDIIQNNYARQTSRNANMLKGLMALACVGIIVVIVGSFIGSKNNSKKAEATLNYSSLREEADNSYGLNNTNGSSNSYGSNSTNNSYGSNNTNGSSGSYNTDPTTTYNSNNNSQTLSENATFWSNDYLFWYVDHYQIDIKSYLTIVSNYAEQVEKYLESDYIHLKQNEYYSITNNEESPFIYWGELKDNRPSGFGIIAERYEFKNTECFAPLYVGEFYKGMFNGQGVLYENCSGPSLEEWDNRTEINDENVNFFITYYLNSIKYIGEFEDGREEKGVKFEYPTIYLGKTMTYKGVPIFQEGVDDKEGHIEITEYSGENVKIYKKGFLSCEYEDGNVTLYYPKSNQIKYKGEWAWSERVDNGQYNGKGTLYYENGQIHYKGEWYQGSYNGTGTEYDENGEIVYSGEWENGDYAS